MDLRKLAIMKNSLDITQAAQSGGLTFSGRNPYPAKKKKAPKGPMSQAEEMRRSLEERAKNGKYSNGVGVGY